MRIAKLRSIAENALLKSSTIPESILAEYSSSTTYAAGARVKVSFASDGVTPRFPVEEYTSLAANNVGNYPPNSPTQWRLDGASNRWAMFDAYTSTQSEALEKIEVEIDSSKQNIVGLFRLQAKEVVLSQIVNTELITSPDCSTDSFTKEMGWAYDATNTQYDCDGTQTTNSRLYQVLTIKPQIHYQVQFVVSNYIAGSVAGYVGGTAGTYVTANGTYTQIIAPGGTDQTINAKFVADFDELYNAQFVADFSATGLSFAGVIADANFIGSIDNISVKKVPNHETISLAYYDVTINSGWYCYFFSELSYGETVIWSFIDYPDSTLRVSIIWKPGDNAKCGTLVIGNQYSLGKTLYEPRVGILDYSRKDTNEFGYTYLKQGNFSKRAEVEAWIYSENIDAIRRVLQSVRGLPIIVDANNSGYTEYGSLKIYGFYRDFDIVIQGPTMSRISITFEGLI